MRCVVVSAQRVEEIDTTARAVSHIRPVDWIRRIWTGNGCVVRRWVAAAYITSAVAESQPALWRRF